MALRKKEETGTRKRKYYITRCGELALEEAIDLSQYKLRNESMRPRQVFEYFKSYYLTSVYEIFLR
jgi:DNA-binding PadR family transcriptional regulator